MWNTNHIAYESVQKVNSNLKSLYPLTFDVKEGEFSVVDQQGRVNVEVKEGEFCISEGNY